MGLVFCKKSFDMTWVPFFHRCPYQWVCFFFKIFQILKNWSVSVTKSLEMDTFFSYIRIFREFPDLRKVFGKFCACKCRKVLIFRKFQDVLLVRVLMPDCRKFLRNVFFHVCCGTAYVKCYSLTWTQNCKGTNFCEQRPVIAVVIVVDKEFFFSIQGTQGPLGPPGPDGNTGRPVSKMLELFEFFIREDFWREHIM